MTIARRLTSVVVLVVASSSCIADLDSFVWNPIHCDAMAARLERDPALCDVKKVCAASCDAPYDFEQWGVPQEIVEQHTVEANDGVTLDSYFLPSSGARADSVIVYAHGNFASVEHYLNRVALAWQTGAHVYAIDYRGFGKSSSAAEPSEVQLMADVALLREQVAHLVPEGTRVFLMGYSAGALAAVEMARTSELCGLILENPWPSVQVFADDSTFIGMPQSFVTTGAWDNIGKMPEIEAPLLHLHGTDDETVRVELGEELFSAAASKDKELVIVEGAGHGNFRNDVPQVMGEAAYVAKLAQFLDAHSACP